MTKVIFYQNADELPCRRFFKFNKYCMLASDVGSTISDYDTRMKKALVYASNGDSENLTKELNNQRQTFWNILQEYSPEGCALACMVKSIDDSTWPDKLSGDNIEDILDRLSKAGYSMGELRRDLADVKKKSSKSLSSTFLRSLIEKIRCSITIKRMS